MTGQERRRRLDIDRRARAAAEAEAVRGLSLDVRILARELFGREGRDLEVSVRTIDWMTSALQELREPLEAERQAQGDAEPGAAKADAAAHRVLCAHADEGGQGMHGLEPGETCDRQRVPDLADSPGMRQLQDHLDEIEAREAGQ